MKCSVMDKYFWIKVGEMDKKYHGSSFQWFACLFLVLLVVCTIYSYVNKQMSCVCWLTSDLFSDIMFLASPIWWFKPYVCEILRSTSTDNKFLHFLDFLAILLYHLFNLVLYFFIKLYLYSCQWLMLFECDCNNENIVRFPLPQVLKCLFTLSFSCSRCRICCLYILILSLNFELPTLLSILYSSLHVWQITM